MAGMFTRFTHPKYESMEDDYEDDYSYRACHHGYIPAHECEQCDAAIEARGGIDKCMNCGKYKYNDQLSYPGQTCLSGCVNPNEY